MQNSYNFISAFLCLYASLCGSDIANDSLISVSWYKLSYPLIWTFLLFNSDKIKHIFPDQEWFTSI